MYNPLTPVITGGGAVGLLPATGVSLTTTILAAVGFVLLIAGIVVVRSAGGRCARFPPVED